MNEEIWKDIPDFPGYQASNLGRIKSTCRLVHSTNGKKTFSYYIPERIMKFTVRSRYLCVTLCLNGKHINVLVHRIIAKTFIPNPYDLPEVNHRDEDKLNNKVTNLEWCTRDYNKNYGTGNIRCAEKRSKKVIQYTDDFFKEWNSINDAARGNNVTAGSIKSACDKHHRCCKCYWKYKI